MIQAAIEAGLPMDQTRRFIQAGYTPLPGMFAFHADARAADRQGGPEWLALGGKRGPGKSHTIMAQVGLDDLARNKDMKALFLRRIQKSARESLEDVIRRVFEYTAHTLTTNGLTLDNGSRLVVGGYKDANDIDKYLGIEYDIIVVEECTQITEDKIQKLRGSLRSSKTTWRPRIYLSTNADGVGLLWFKKMFIEPWRKQAEGITRFHDVTSIRNPFINAEYDAWLDSLTGPLRLAWKDGNWDAFAGQAFPMWNQEEHVIEPFDIPVSWPKWRAIDEGMAAPWCCLWFTRDPSTRRQYVFREAYQAELTLDQQADRINDMSPPTEFYQFTFADPAMWQRKNYKNRVYSAYDQYKDKGIVLTQADNDRINGKRKVDQVLSLAPDGLPAVQIFKHCTYIIEQLSSLARDKLNPEDVDTTAEDHAYDAFRYGQTNEKKILTMQPGEKRIQYRDPLAGVRGI
jgi:phage terminase large subunit